MQIDWITVSAQIVNFLILVWLLRHFLYQPVIRAMDRREQRIAEQLHSAEDREQEASEKAAHYEEKTRALEQRREEIIAKATEEAEQQKKQMLDEARDSVAETRKRWQRQAEQEKEEFFSQLRQQTTDAVQAIARKVLTDLADAELEERVIHKFIEQLKAMDKETCTALTQTQEPLSIHSAFKLDSGVRGRLTRFIHEHLAADLKVEYSTKPELLCGIQLVSNNQQAGWNLNAYLDDLTEHIDKAVSSVRPGREEEA